MINRYQFGAMRLAGGIVLLIFFLGCSDQSNPAPGQEVLIRVGEDVISVQGFQAALDSAAVTYPADLFQDVQALQDLKYRVLNQIAEELVISNRAKELNLHVGDEEFNRAIAQFKKEYPDAVFERMLLENGVSPVKWRQGLRNRLLIDKVIENDLVLGKQKAEAAYPQWIDDLKKRHTVVINWALWETIWEKGFDKNADNYK